MKTSELIYGQLNMVLEDRLEYDKLLFMVKDAVNFDRRMNGVQIIEMAPTALAIRIETDDLLGLIDLGQTFGAVQAEDDLPSCTMWTSIYNSKGECIASVI